jgi:hypothetical protein
MRYEVTQKDIDEALLKHIESLDPFKLKIFPSKEKKKYVLLGFIIELFEKDKAYSEKEVNEILKPVYKDFAIIRRYLVDYNYLDRLDNGSAYWVVIDRKKIEHEA